MRISELAQATQVPVHTLKYYLREGVLMPGTPTGQTRAEYGPEHVERVLLLRALVEHGGVGIAGVRAILDALAAPPASHHDFLGVAHQVTPLAGADSAPSEEVTDLLEALGWDADPSCPPARALGAALAGAHKAGLDYDRDLLVRYARAMADVAAIDLSVVDTAPDPVSALRLVVLGNVMIDPALVALRRLAQEAASARREP